MPDQFLHFESVRIDLHDIRSLLAGGCTALPRSENRTVGRPADIVHAKTKRDDISLRWCLSTRQAEERLASPGSNVEPFAVLGYLQTICAGCFAPGNNFPTLTGMPFPNLA